MHSHHLDKQLDRHYAQGALLDRLQQPSIVIPLALILFTFFYQYLHSSPFSRSRYPGKLIWDLIIAVTPAPLLYALDNWFRPPTSPRSDFMLSTQSCSYAAKSGFFQRMLGMDGSSSIITSVADAGMRSLSNLSNSTLGKHKTDRPPGLGNLNNSCFQNSILQGLSSLKPFPTYLERGLAQDISDVDGESRSASSLLDLISKLTDPSYNGQLLWTPDKLKSLDTWQQQDAQEYFSKILDEVEKEITKAAKPQHCSPGFETVSTRDDTEDSQHSDDSGYQSLPMFSKVGSDARVLRNPLEGLAAQRVSCVRCGYSDGLSMTPFNCITLNLGLEQTEHDLYERLDSYTDLETIEGVECAKCTLLKLQRLLRIIVARGKEHNATEAELRESISRLRAVDLALEEDDFQEKTLKDSCKVQARISSTKTKQIAIARPPQSLAIHMNRSVFDESTGHMRKNLAAVRFPRTLDLGPWCLGSAGGPVSLVDNDVNASASASEDEERWVTDPVSSMVSGDQKSSRISGPIYELRAVITHKGHHENGHYICYRKHPYRSSERSDAKVKHSDLLDEDDCGTSDDENMLVGGHSGANTESDIKSKWWQLSDESVLEVTEDEVLAQGGVFMLFYDCVDPNCLLVSTTRHETSDVEGGPTMSLGEKNIEAGLAAHRMENDEQLQKLVQAVDVNSSTDSEARIPSQGAEPSFSRLIPPLTDDEQVDPTIPLHRPNSIV
ncbi:cysteine proteinase [Hypoxylon sp. NC1633]|nr:cysteine proteinase [Hypoxylon sp. NC1633]